MSCLAKTLHTRSTTPKINVFVCQSHLLFHRSVIYSSSLCAVTRKCASGTKRKECQTYLFFMPHARSFEVKKEVEREREGGGSIKGKTALHAFVY